MIGTSLSFVLASVLVPTGVAWFASLAGEPFRSWKAHPWVCFCGQKGLMRFHRAATDAEPLACSIRQVARPVACDYNVIT